MRKKLIRITTVPGSLGVLLDGQLAYMSKYYDVIGIASKGKEPNTLVKVAVKENIRVIPVEMSRQITLFKDIKGVWQLYKIFKKECPYIVHTHTPKAGLLGMLAAYLARVPNRLHTVAGMPLLEVTGFKRKLLDLVEKLTYFCATKVFPNSFGLQEIIIKTKYASQSKVKVLGDGSSNGIDTTHFDPTLFQSAKNDAFRASLGISKMDFVFVFVGRLVKDKGINELVEAFTSLQQNESNIFLLLVGGFEKELDPLLPGTTSEIEQNDRILSVGWQNDVRPFFAIANALVFPSYREGFPNAVLQASAMGLPGIVSDINGCNEIIRDGENGLIVPPKNVQALYQAMKMLTEDTEAVKMIPSEIRKVIETKYGRQQIWQKILKEYESL